MTTDVMILEKLYKVRSLYEQLAKLMDAEIRLFGNVKKRESLILDSGVIMAVISDSSAEVDTRDRMFLALVFSLDFSFTENILTQIYPQLRENYPGMTLLRGWYPPKYVKDVEERGTEDTMKLLIEYYETLGDACCRMLTDSPLKREQLNEYIQRLKRDHGITEEARDPDRMKVRAPEKDAVVAPKKE